MTRGHVELAHAPQIPEEVLPASGWPSGPVVRILSRDEDTGAFSAVLSLPPGYRRHPGHLSADSELLVLGGSLRIGGDVRGLGYYEYAPASSDQEAWSTEGGVTLLFCARGGSPDLLPGRGSGAAEARVMHDTERMDWMVSPVPGPPEGMVLKILRHVEATGELTALCSTVPAYDYPMLEFHDCVEEIYLIDGDIWLGNSGLMTAGSYLWRPPFVTHGPFFSQTGALMLVWVPSTLVNHVPASPASTPEENIAAFVAAGGERVLAADTG
jgi:hypothetical protein